MRGWQAGRGDGRIIAVTGVSGGVGASSLATMLARAMAAQGRSVALVDADPCGTLRLNLGAQVHDGLVWADIPQGESAFRPGKLSAALPEWLGVRVLSGDEAGMGGPVQHALVEAVVEALTQAHDAVIVDVPRGVIPPLGSQVLLLADLSLRGAVGARIHGARLRELQAEQAGLQVGPSTGPQRGKGVEPGAGGHAPAQEAALPAGPGTSAWAQGANPGGPPWPGAGIRLVVRQEGDDLREVDLERVAGCEVLGYFPPDRSIAARHARGEDITRGRGAARREVARIATLLIDELSALSAATPRQKVGRAKQHNNVTQGGGNDASGAQLGTAPRHTRSKPAAAVANVEAA